MTLFVFCSVHPQITPTLEQEVVKNTKPNPETLQKLTIASNDKTLEKNEITLSSFYPNRKNTTSAAIATLVVFALNIVTHTHSPLTFGSALGYIVGSLY